MDLTGYKISLERNPLGWGWSATDPDGAGVPKTAGTNGGFWRKEEAEKAALSACEDHASKPEVIDAEDLRQRFNAEPAHRS